MKVRLEFKLEDFWIGVFWREDSHYHLHIWLCILPCLPIHFTIDNTRKHAKALAEMIMNSRVLGYQKKR